ncbi:MAG: hypothetical protein CFE44_13710 [Burkholderiales bacterium PBB4]|nr:MAG: hypothetical protein CFE44_13710 [Burkholderiales bacterium PBB4]
MLDASLISVSSSTEVATAVLIGWEPATEIHGQSAPAACNTTPLPYLKLANPEWTPKAQDLAMLITMVDSLSAPFANLLHACLANDTDMKAFLAVPGSCHHHHAFRGGLLAHTIEVMLLVERMCEAMKGADRDVAIAAAMLHDIGKCREYTINRLDMSRRTKQGKLLVHRQIGYAMLLDALKRCPIEAHMSLELQHCLVAADGPNYMSLPRKQTIEAHILQAADGVSASAKSEDRR